MQQDTSKSLIDNELNRIARASVNCEMCRLHEAREVQDRDAKQALRDSLFVSKLTSRKHRRTIANLYMAVAFLAVMVLYLFVRGK